jgi:hypothetical protein
MTNLEGAPATHARTHRGVATKQDDLISYDEETDSKVVFNALDFSQ